MSRGVYEFTVVCVVEGDDPADAWVWAMAYLAEQAGKGELSYGQCELLEEVK